MILSAVAQGWPPRLMQAMLQTFLLHNQAAILAHQWWAGLLTREVLWRPVSTCSRPRLAVVLGIRSCDRIDHLRFRRVIFAMLFA